MTSSGGDEERTPQEKHGKVVTQWPTSKASLGWKNGKLWLGSWMSTGASTEDGWRPQVSDLAADLQRNMYIRQRDDIYTHWCWWIVNQKRNATTHWTGSWQARPTKWNGGWNGQVAHVLEWRAIGLPLWHGMLLPTERYLHQLWRDGIIPFKASKLKWQSMRSCSLKEKGGYIYAPKKYPTFDYYHS